MTQPPPTPQSTSRKKVTALVAGAAVAAFAIGGGVALLLNDDGDSDNKPAVTKATGTSSPPSPSSSPSPEEEQEFKLGDTVDIDEDHGSLSAAALAYRDEGIKGIPEMLSPGEKWAVLDVKVCNTGGDPIQASPFPWSLAYEGGVRVESAGMNAGDLPKPLYPMDAKVAAGDCVRGNIVFQVPEEGRPERVLYSPSVLDEPVEWQVPKG
ncbi:hypothetical protein SUDANB15_07158 [Streptomyces sp. enrichment culture]|uniref:DUF4352 domain-containing protein n=1 Tax=Streptomyces sp. enrichment culture TaxID=1795815 RepID=UPI003F544E0A